MKDQMALTFSGILTGAMLASMLSGPLAASAQTRPFVATAQTRPFTAPAQTGTLRATSQTRPLAGTVQARPVAATVPSRPLGQHPISRGSNAGARAAKVRIGPRTRFGTIVSLQANAFVMSTRARGKLLTVDDTIALQTGTYSFPLFVGKLVMVTGDLDANGILHANTITRLPSLDAYTPGDR